MNDQLSSYWTVPSAGEIVNGYIGNGNCVSAYTA